MSEQIYPVEIYNEKDVKVAEVTDRTGGII